ncbi:MAG: helix-turn-helix domain-containing protein [Clostridia bacterium]
MKNKSMCEIVFENLESNVRGIFSTEHLLNCFDPLNTEKYKLVFENKNIKTVLSDEELLQMAEHFFKNNLNISKSSKTGFMHRNTLIYRLDKIQSLTGLNLRNLEDAVIFLNLLSIKKYIENK